MNSYLSQLLNKIETRTTRVAVIGLGYVGPPLVVAFAEAGHHVIGIYRRKVEDISYIIAAGDEIGRYLHPGMLVVRESTTYPGTRTEIIFPPLRENSAKLKVGEDFFLCLAVAKRRLLRIGRP